MPTETTAYTDADVELVANALWAECGAPGPATPTCREDARAALDSLARAGRLLPTGGKKRTEHEIDWQHRDREQDSPTMTYDDFAEHQVDNEIAEAGHLGYEPRQVRRRAILTWPDGATFTSAWEMR
ncbi:hypothetical protein ACGF5C_31620 [Micromonospora sp. NPDC047620]|uniref:hypothetical protein n=1 Tax=Micromonospora sp. NPDC047620 TaxID=3364251 RepID=UPI003714681D